MSVPQAIPRPRRGAGQDGASLFMKWRGPLTIAMSVLALVGSTLSWIASRSWSAGSDYTRVNLKLEQLDRGNDDHEARLRMIESRLGEIAGDLKAIRQYFNIPRESEKGGGHVAAP